MPVLFFIYPPIDLRIIVKILSVPDRRPTPMRRADADNTWLRLDFVSDVVLNNSRNPSRAQPWGVNKLIQRVSSGNSSLGIMHPPRRANPSEGKSPHMDTWAMVRARVATNNPKPTAAILEDVTIRPNQNRLVSQ